MNRKFKKLLYKQICVILITYKSGYIKFVFLQSIVSSWIVTCSIHNIECTLKKNEKKNEKKKEKKNGWTEKITYSALAREN